MKNNSLEELMRAIETVLAGEIYASKAIASLAMRKFARRGDLPEGTGVLSESRVGCAFFDCGRARPQSDRARTRRQLQTVECHCEHIKFKLGYPDAEALHRGTRGTTQQSLNLQDRNGLKPLLRSRTFEEFWWFALRSSPARLDIREQWAVPRGSRFAPQGSS
jgi:hypothetical protein